MESVAETQREFQPELAGQIGICAMARAVVNDGCSIVPVDPSTKKPRCAWKQYQEHIADEPTLQKWLTSGLKACAFICGKVSRDLCIIDFDVPEFFDRWRADVGNLADGLPVQRTGGGGYQVALRFPNPGGNEKLAWTPDETEESGRTIAIETRGEGGYAVMPGSLHPSGKFYQTIQGDFTAIPTISRAHADALLNAAKKLDEAPFTKQELAAQEQQAIEAHSRKAKISNNGCASVIQMFNEAHDITKLLEQRGYTRGPHGRYCRPGREGIESISIADGRSCHFSTNDPLNDGKVKSGIGVHDAFDVFAFYEFGGNVSKAVKAVAEILGIKPERKQKARDDQPCRGFNEAPSSAGGIKAILSAAADIEVKRIEWLWRGKLALGKINLLCGDPGVNKSTVTLALAAHVTRGRDWPDGQSCPGGSAIVFNAEDDAADTMIKRLMAAGADLQKIQFLNGISLPDTAGRRTKSFTLEHIHPLADAIDAIGDCRLLIIDPVSACLADSDSHKNAEIRGLLAPLAKMAAERGVCVLLVTHLNKGAGGKAMYRAMASLAFVAAARSAWLVAKDKLNDRRRLILPIKNNLGNDTDGIAFTVKSIDIDGDDVPQIEWESCTVRMKADEALSEAEEESRHGPEPTGREAAMQWLTDLLAVGPLESDKIRAEGKSAGLSWSTIRRAQSIMGIKPYRNQFGGAWLWKLPPGRAHAEDAQVNPTHEQLEQLGQPEQPERLWNINQKIRVIAPYPSSNPEDAQVGTVVAQPERLREQGEDEYDREERLAMQEGGM